LLSLYYTFHMSSTIQHIVLAIAAACFIVLPGQAGQTPPQPLVQPINTLVLSGGGVKGIAYVGALQAYEEITKQEISSIQHVIGSSAGSITALLVALGYTTEKIKEITWTANFKDFMDTSGKIESGLCLISVYGYYRGEFMYEYLKGLIVEKVNDGGNFINLGLDPTLANIYEKTGIHLTVFTTDLANNASKIFSSTDPGTKNISAAYAVRTSASIPLFFDAMFYQQDSSGVLTQAPDNLSFQCVADSSDSKYTAFVDGLFKIFE